MSRIGKKPISIPSGVNVSVSGDLIVVKGPKGELKQKIHPQVKITSQDNVIKVAISDETDKSQRALWGLFASLVINMIDGVTKGFSKQLEISGVGFKATVSGGKLILNVGFSHPVEFVIPKGIEIKVEGGVITIGGFDKQLVGEISSQIRKVKKAEPYKGKGIKYVGEQIRRKAGKTAAKGA